MKNPLRYRYARDLRSNIGKYLVIFLFMALLVSLVSGYMVAADSVKKVFYDQQENCNIEDGHIVFGEELKSSMKEKIEDKADFKMYQEWYASEDIDNDGTTLRVFESRKKLNIEQIYEGELPTKLNEIALDRLFMENNDLETGDTITLNDKKFKVTGSVSLVDYGSLYENESDMMFNAKNFGVAIVTQRGFEYLDSNRISYCYAYKYNTAVKDDDDAAERADELEDIFSGGLNSYDADSDQSEMGYLLDVMENFTMMLDAEFSDEDFIKNYQPAYNSKAVNYCMDDMSSDKPMFLIFDYIVTLILAFVFAVTISNTIMQESSSIGTLRALGYTRMELLRHYMTMPMLASIAGAAVGNVVGYTYIQKVMCGVFYGSFSLPVYHTVFNAEAFVLTTVIPLASMFVINVVVLSFKLRLKPINFIRRDLKKRRKRNALHLGKRLRFMTRFRLRILFQNMSAYITMSAGIIMAGVIVVFGLMFLPMLDQYGQMIQDSKICNYQYILKEEKPTDTAGAEKYCINSLDLEKEGYLTDEISVYGISRNSDYITKEIPEGKVLVSEGILAKYNLEVGDTLTLKEQNEDTKYKFKIAGTYNYDAALSVFMNRDDYNAKFDEPIDYFSGYFSNRKITDIEKNDIATVVTSKDLVKLTDQLMDSFGGFMGLFVYFGVAMFILMMYLMTKQIIEKNMQSIAMTKILGFRNSEISRLYIVLTSLVVIASLLISIPMIDGALRCAFASMIYTEISGYIPYIVDSSCYMYEFLIGIGCYAVVSIFMMRKIGKVDKSIVLKNVE